MQDQTPRTAPRISLNKLGEYLTATPARRRSIVQQQKYPATFRTARYREAYSAIAACCLTGFDPGILNQTLASLAASTGSENEMQRLHNCQEALSHFASMIEDLPFDEVQLSAPEGQLPYLMLGGVEVSVRPELLCSGVVGRPPQARSGAIKFYFSKTNPLTLEAAQYVGAVTLNYLADCLIQPDPVDYRMVWVVDVFAEQIFPAPKSTVRKIDDAVAACEEILGRWALL